MTTTLPVLLVYRRRGASLTIGVVKMDDLNKPLNDEEWNELSISCWAVLAVAALIGIILFTLGGIVMSLVGG